MTSSAVEIDNDILEVLDFEHETPCEATVGVETAPQCPSPATWSLTMDCCGIVILLCDVHSAELFRANGKISHEFFMNPCGKRYVSILSAEKI